MTEFLYAYGFDNWAFWQQYLLRGLLISLLLVASAVAATRAGRSPYWALLMIVPYGAVVALWLFAFTAWPKEKPPEETKPA